MAEVRYWIPVFIHLMEVVPEQLSDIHVAGFRLSRVPRKPVVGIEVVCVVYKGKEVPTYSALSLMNPSLHESCAKRAFPARLAVRSLVYAKSHEKVRVNAYQNRKKERKKLTEMRRSGLYP